MIKIGQIEFDRGDTILHSKFDNRTEEEYIKEVMNITDLESKYCKESLTLYKLDNMNVYSFEQEIIVIAKGDTPKNIIVKIGTNGCAKEVALKAYINEIIYMMNGDIDEVTEYINRIEDKDDNDNKCKCCKT